MYPGLFTVISPASGTVSGTEQVLKQSTGFRVWTLGAQWPSLDSRLPCLQATQPRAGQSHLCVSLAWGSSSQVGDHTASSTMQRAWHREHLIRTHHSYFLATSSLWTISPTPVLSKMSRLLPLSVLTHPKAGGEMLDLSQHPLRS